MRRPVPGAYNSVSTLRGYLLLAYSTKELQTNNAEENPSSKKYRNWLEKSSYEFYSVYFKIVLFSLDIFMGIP